jgi:hypothetical protein
MAGEQIHQTGLFPARVGLSLAVLAGVGLGLTVVEGEQGGSDCGEEVLALIALVEAVLEPPVER